eukprot:3210859-Rhodomonas_salina.1
MTNAKARLMVAGTGATVPPGTWERRRTTVLKMTEPCANLSTLDNRVRKYSALSATAPGSSSSGANT